MTIPNTDIKAAAARYETLLTEMDTLREDMKELGKELKNNGIDVKALKKAVKIKRTPPDVSHEDTVRVYLSAMGVRA